MSSDIDIKSTIRVFTIAFELYNFFDSRWRARKWVLLKDLKDWNNIFNEKHAPFNGENRNTCTKGTGSDIFTFSLDGKEDELDDYLKRISERKHNNLTEKGRDGFLHLGFKKLEMRVELDSQDKHQDVQCYIKIFPVLHLDVKNFYNKKGQVNKKARLNNIASFNFIIQTIDCEDQKTFVETDLKNLYINLEIPKEEVKDKEPTLLKTLDSIRNNKEKINEIYFHDGRTKINLRTFLLFYIWESFLGDFRLRVHKKKLDFLIAFMKKLFSQKQNKDNRYTSVCRFVNALHDLISLISYESISLSFKNPEEHNELNYDIDTSLLRKLTSQNENWYDFLLQIFKLNKSELWEGKFFQIRKNELIKRDIEGAMYFSNTRLYLSYIDDKITSTVKASENNLRWDATWGVLLGNILCGMSQTFVLYNEKIEDHVKKGAKIKILFNLIRQASFDFKYFYDADNVQSFNFRSAIETGKEAFYINSQHEKLLERINLFSDYELQENNHILNTMIMTGGTIGSILLGATLDIMLLQYHFYFLFSLTIKMEIVVSIVIIALYLYEQFSRG